MGLDITRLIRKSLLKHSSYSSARDDFYGTAQVYLDANENPYDSEINRYPDPRQFILKKKIAQIKGIGVPNLFLGNGSDEVIDLLIRAFCQPREDNILIMPPTYGMYKVSAHINEVEILSVPLCSDFSLNEQAVLSSINQHTKLIFICSPNNPTGNLIDKSKIKRIADIFRGIIVLDEAYIDFAQTTSFVEEIAVHQNVFVLQTFSKAWGMAGLRLGVGIGDDSIVNILNRIKPPYNINVRTQTEVLENLEREEQVKQWVVEIVKERQSMINALKNIKSIRKVYASQANFILVQIDKAREVYTYLISKGIIVRDRSQVQLCIDCLRITVGTPEQNKQLIKVLKNHI